jgi:hypothetical protein
MAQAPNNPNVEKAADIPYDKDSVSPLLQFKPRARGVGGGRSHTGLPVTHEGGPEPKEEYPGPQNAPSGGRAEPGRVDPGKQGDA